MCTFNITLKYFVHDCKSCKSKGLPQQAEVPQGGPNWLRPRILLTFGTTRVVGRQLYAAVAFIPVEILGNYF
jgi:hypothetical protein